MEPPGVALASAEDWSWRSTDGLEIHGWFYRARVDHGRAVVYIHGGPSMHMEERLHPLIHYLAWCGFHVLVPNYRGSTGYGMPFQRLIREDGWGGREMDDILTGIQKMVREGLAEPGRVGLTGTSYGGYACWRLATSVPLEWVSAIAPVCGMTDLVLDFQTTRPDLRRLSAEMMGGTPEEIPQRYFERSPIHFIHNLKARVLVVQGANDINVTKQNITAVCREMERHGVDYQLLEFKDEGHGIRNSANLKVLYHHLGSFFEDALGWKPGEGLHGPEDENG